MSKPDLKHYFSYHEMLMDFASLAPAIDVEKSLSVAPPMSFYTTDGRIALGGNFVHFLTRLREETGLKVLPFSSEEHVGYYLVSFEDYSKVEEAEVKEKIEVKPVDSPAKKRSQRTSLKK